jgi:restriction system protein
MKSYYRVMLGKGSKFAKEGFAHNYIGANYEINIDLKDRLPDNWREFNKEFIPIYLQNHPDKSRIAAGLACGTIWTIAKGIKIGDFVLCPDGQGIYHVGEVTGDYLFMPTLPMPHQRPVRWLDKTIPRSDMSEALRHSTGAIGAMSNISQYVEEIDRLIGSISEPQLIATDENVEDPMAFALEKHLEDFLVQNWKNTALGKDYEIFKEEGELVGQQYLTDTGPIDILAVSKDKKTLLIVELKKGRGSDVVVGQVLRYMGYVQDELVEKGQKVKGVIIAMEDDQRMRRALSVTPNIEFYRYEVTFKLAKG